MEQSLNEGSRFNGYNWLGLNSDQNFIKLHAIHETHKHVWLQGLPIFERPFLRAILYRKLNKYE